MAAFRWIKMILLLILMLQFIAAQTETRRTFLTVRDGNEVTLPCGNRRDTLDESDLAVWLFSHKHTSEITTLVRLGHTHREMKTITDRLSVTANGSLLLHKVTEDDEGQYICQWITSGQPNDFVVNLSVIKKETQSTPTPPTHHWTSAGSNNEVKHQDLFYLLRWIVVSVGLAALVISVVIINLWSKTKGKKTQNDQNLECSHEDEEEGVEIYEN